MKRQVETETVDKQTLTLVDPLELTQRGLSLGYLEGLVTPTEAKRVRDWKGEWNKDFEKDNGNLYVFCGQRNGIATAYLNQTLLVEGDISEMTISIGLDETKGVLRYWLTVVGEMGIEITGDGRVFFRDKTGKATDISKLSPRAKESLVEDEQLKAILLKFNEVGQIKELLGKMVRHEIFNPYIPWARQRILTTCLTGENV